MLDRTYFGRFYPASLCLFAPPWVPDPTRPWCVRVQASTGRRMLLANSSKEKLKRRFFLVLLKVQLRRTCPLGQLFCITLADHSFVLPELTGLVNSGLRATSEGLKKECTMAVKCAPIKASRVVGMVNVTVL